MVQTRSIFLTFVVFVNCGVTLSQETGGQLQPIPDRIGSDSNQRMNGRCGCEECSRSMMLDQQSRCNDCETPLRTDCGKYVVQSGCQSSCEPCSRTTRLPIFNEGGGKLDEIHFPRPILQVRSDEVVVEPFEVTVRNVSGQPSEYVLVAGVVRTASSKLKSEVELQVDVLTQSNQVVRIRQQNIANAGIDPEQEGTLRVFVKLIHTTTNEVRDHKYSEEWRLRDLKVGDSNSRIRPDQQVVIRLPY